MKRGNIFDLIFVMVALLIVSLFLIFAHMLNGQIYDKFDNSTSINASLMAETEGALEIFDTGFVLILLGLFAFVLMSAFFIQSHPIFFVAGLIALTIIVFVSPTITNVYDQVIQEENISDSANSYPIMTATMREMPLIITVLGGLVLIVLYAKTQGIGGGVI